MYLEMCAEQINLIMKYNIIINKFVVMWNKYIQNS